ncbi:pyridoxamine 5'-phosphate oxidase family protein [Tropicibacter sp. R16_0]|uniref:pyridoxamine 5'-phosphate oxidase family protein n=1 Tax=Tropicibacter sp. R16_0 TaxID=2821102 RepID=UPI001ADAEEA4|nr:pyridoxamine 5'-phosphate oxidase family protein [Tropicibacter sp. R16_0]MBO9449768.1 pyridoxamine 5'-phosphate oxidase family protein [Tropicibacter sp. R16_0]
MTKPTLTAAWAQAWAILQQAIADDRSPLRFVTLATVDANHAPQLRSVVLRELDAEAATLYIFTDARSHKVAELGKNNAVSLHLWAPDHLIQLRLSGQAQISSGTPIRDHWDTVPDHMREAYGHVPSPGTKIATPDAWEVRPDIQNFAKITLILSHIDIVCLSRDGHWRVEFLRENNWKGDWLSP